MLSIIVAVAENNVIGANNRLLWNISEDLKRFKRITEGHKVIMGKNTFLSLPNGPLPNRENIVISDNKNDKFDGCVMAYCIEEAIALCQDDDESFIIGGGMIYEQFMKYADKLYLTKVHTAIEGDTFFPEIDAKKWKLTEDIRDITDEKGKYSYSFLTYVK